MRTILPGCALVSTTFRICCLSTSSDESFFVLLRCWTDTWASSNCLITSLFSEVTSQTTMKDCSCNLRVTGKELIWGGSPGGPEGQDCECSPQLQGLISSSDDSSQCPRRLTPFWEEVELQIYSITVHSSFVVYKNLHLFVS